jgi:hypothetical protein
VIGEIGHIEDVALGLYNERADAERPDAVLNAPAFGLENEAAGQRHPAGREVTSKTIAHPRLILPDRQTMRP